MAWVALRNGRLVAPVGTHPRDGSRFGQLDQLAIDVLERWRRFDAATRTRSLVRVGRHLYMSLRGLGALSQTTIGTS